MGKVIRGKFRRGKFTSDRVIRGMLANLVAEYGRDVLLQVEQIGFDMLLEEAMDNGHGYSKPCVRCGFEGCECDQWEDIG